MITPSLLTSPSPAPGLYAYSQRKTALFRFAGNLLSKTCFYASEAKKDAVKSATSPQDCFNLRNKTKNDPEQVKARLAVYRALVEPQIRVSPGEEKSYFYKIRLALYRVLAGSSTIKPESFAEAAEKIPSFQKIPPDKPHSDGSKWAHLPEQVRNVLDSMPHMPFPAPMPSAESCVTRKNKRVLQPSLAEKTEQLKRKALETQRALAVPRIPENTSTCQRRQLPQHFMQR